MGKPVGKKLSGPAGTEQELVDPPKNRPLGETR